MLTAIGWGTFLFFGVINALFIPIIYFTYPETAGRTLEEIDLMYVPSSPRPKISLTLHSSVSRPDSPRTAPTFTSLTTCPSSPTSRSPSSRRVFTSRVKARSALLGSPPREPSSTSLFWATRRLRVSLASKTIDFLSVAGLDYLVDLHLDCSEQSASNLRSGRPPEQSASGAD